MYNVKGGSSYSSVGRARCLYLEICECTIGNYAEVLGSIPSGSIKRNVLYNFKKLNYIKKSVLCVLCLNSRFATYNFANNLRRRMIVL